MKRITHNIIPIITFIACTLSAHAQQTAQYSLWRLNPFATSPAYAGLDGSLAATAAFRKQWVNLPGSPTSVSINAHLPWYYAHGGAGFTLENDYIGAEQTLNAQLAYAYHYAISNDATLSAGISAGILQKTLDGTILRPANQDQADQYIANTKISAITPITQASIYFKNKNLNISAGFIQFSPTNLRYNTTPTTNTQLWNTYQAMFAYKITLSDNFAIEPALLVKTDPAQLQTDFSTLFYIQDNIFTGITLRGYNKNSLDAATISAGMRLNKNWTAAYAYDIGISPLSNAHQGSHELLLKYNLNQKIGYPKPLKIIYNSRFW